MTLAIGIAIVTVGATSTEDEHGPFTANGTVLATGDRAAAFITADFAGQTQIIQMALSKLRDLSGGRRANLKDDEAVQIMLVEQPDGTFLAIQYEELAKGSMVNNTAWGVQEAYTTRDDSINARVDNGPDDDEARNQGDHFDVKGRRVDDD